MKNALMFGSVCRRQLIHDVNFELVQSEDTCIAIYKENVLIMIIDLHSLNFEMSNEIFRYYTIC